jgi:hypothetical protein
MKQSPPIDQVKLAKAITTLALIFGEAVERLAALPPANAKTTIDAAFSGSVPYNKLLRKELSTASKYACKALIKRAQKKEAVQ